MDCSLLGSSLHGILQARILEWVAISFSTEAEAPILWSPDAKNWLIGKDLMLGKIEGRRRGQQRVRWLDGITNSTDMIWTNSRRWWRTGKSVVLQSMESELDTTERLINMELLVETRPLGSHDSSHTAHTVNPPFRNACSQECKKLYSRWFKTNRRPVICPAKIGLFGINKELQFCNHRKLYASLHRTRRKLFYRGGKEVGRAVVNRATGAS